MSTLDISVREVDGVTILAATGAIDAGTYTELEAAAARAIDGGADRILLDLSGVDYMGSAGFRALHGITNRLSDEDSEHTIQSGRLKLLSPSESVMRVMKTLGFDAYLETFDSEEAALKAF